MGFWSSTTYKTSVFRKKKWMKLSSSSSSSSSENLEVFVRYKWHPFLQSHSNPRVEWKNRFLLGFSFGNCLAYCFCCSIKGWTDQKCRVKEAQFLSTLNLLSSFYITMWSNCFQLDMSSKIALSLIDRSVNWTLPRGFPWSIPRQKGNWEARFGFSACEEIYVVPSKTSGKPETTQKPGLYYFSAYASHLQHNESEELFVLAISNGEKQVLTLYWQDDMFDGAIYSSKY